MKNWDEVERPNAPKKRERKPRNRNRVHREDEEEARQDPVDGGNGSGGAEIEIEDTAPEVQGHHERGDHEGGGEDAKSSLCPVCDGLLTCKRCDTSIEAQAQKILKGLGDKWAETVKTNRVLAFENHAEGLMTNLDVLVASRMISLDSIVKIVSSIHTMIGAPKKKTESADVDPLEHLKEWLGGEDVPGFPNAPLPPPEESLTEEEAEEEEAQVG